MYYIGIDPGLKGGIAVVTEKGDAWAKPYSNEELKGLCKFSPEGTIAVLEKVHAMPHQGVTSTFNFGMSFGYIKGVLEANGIHYKLIDPRTWQNAFNLRPKHTKEDSIAKVKELFPAVNLKPTRRSRKDSDGMSDALLIAEWGRENISQE